MFDFKLWLDALAVMLALGFAAWLVSLPLRNVSIVDSLWSLLQLAAVIVYARGAHPAGPRAMVVAVLTLVWSQRLAIYITWRNRGHGEDRRYQQIRRNNDPGFAIKSLYIVFGLQCVLAWVVSLPLLAALQSRGALGLIDAMGVALWLLGMSFEVIGDAQLAAFRRDPQNHGRVLNTGLWRYTRHPNYFGECCLWWGIYLLALGAGGWWAIASPLLMSLLLLKVSGVTLLERDIGERRPEYAEYVAATSAFFPWPPRRRPATDNGVAR
jgi:steroid 5-alpha reductase family enzyme